VSAPTPLDLYYAGRLQDALAAANEQVRRQPTDLSARGFLCEMLCFAGEFERADKQLEVISTQDPALGVGVAQFRQLIRAEQARQQFFAEGRPPEFLTAVTPACRLALEASIRIREGQLTDAVSLLDQAEAQRPRLYGTCDGQPFTDLRDMDDLTGAVFEVLTGAGKYYWVPMEHVQLLEFRPHGRARDLLWRHARMVVRDGPDSEIFLPALYPGAAKESDDRLRLGRMTEWRGEEGQPIHGAGQRMLLAGEADHPFLELKTLTIEPPAKASPVA
jgi:type VI secretion system protein ImpE